MFYVFLKYFGGEKNQSPGGTPDYPQVDTFLTEEIISNYLFFFCVWLF